MVSVIVLVALDEKNLEVMETTTTLVDGKPKKTARVGKHSESMEFAIL